MSKKERNIFVDGAIAPAFIAAQIAAHQSKTGIGAHQIFLGQVRADELNGESVAAIEYTCYPEMANEEMSRIREEVFAQYELTCLHVYHSIGLVNSGELSLFVFASARHRKPAIEGCAACVELIKSRLPVWGKELTAGGLSNWKVNTSA